MDRFTRMFYFCLFFLGLVPAATADGLDQQKALIQQLQDSIQGSVDIDCSSICGSKFCCVAANLSMRIPTCVYNGNVQFQPTKDPMELQKRMDGCQADGRQVASETWVRNLESEMMKDRPDAKCSKDCWSCSSGTCCGWTWDF